MVQSHPNLQKHHQKVISSLIYIIMPTSSIQALYHLMSLHKGWVQYNKTFWERDNIHIMLLRLFYFAVVQSPSHVQLFTTQWTAALRASLSLTITWNLPKFMSIALVMPSSQFIPCHPLLLSSIFPSIRVFSNELALCIRWPQYWSFSISPSNEYSWLISFKIDWLDLLAVQETLKSLLQHHSSKASILWHSAFFMAQLPLLVLVHC